MQRLNGGEERRGVAATFEKEKERIGQRKASK